MEIQEKIDNAKQDARFAYMGFLDSLYQMPLFQRWILVIGVLVLLFGYILAKIATGTFYEWHYNKNLSVSVPSFESPQAVTSGAAGLVFLNEGGVLAYSELTNPNLTLSVRKVSYNFILQNAQGQTVGRQSGQTFLLPGQTRQVVSSRITSLGKVEKVTLQVGDAVFQKRLSLPEASMTVTNTQVLGSEGDKRIEGALVNNSPYVLGSVELVVRLDSRTTGELLAVFSRYEYSVRSSERRTFVIPWPDLPDTESVKVTVTPYTNILDVANLRVDASSLPSGGGR